MRKRRTETDLRATDVMKMLRGPMVLFGPRCLSTVCCSRSWSLQHL
jgi:hypothetical protein